MKVKNKSTEKTAPSRPKWLRIVQIIFLCLLTLYSLIGFIGLPLGLKWFAQNKLKFQTPHTLKLQHARFNPFTLELRLEDLEIYTEQQQRIVGFDRFEIDVSFLALIKKNYRVERLLLDGLYVKTILRKDGSINLMGLQPAANPDKAAPNFKTAKNPDTKASEMPSVIVDRLIFSNGALYLRDENLKKDFAYVIRPFSFHMLDFTTRPDENGNLDLLFELADGGQINLNGFLAIQPLSALINIKIHQIPLAAGQSYVSEYAQAQIADGKLNLVGRVNFDGTDLKKPLLTFNGGLSIDHLKILDDQAEPVLAWKALSLTPIAFDLAKNQLMIEAVTLNGLDLQATLTSEGSNIQNLMKTTPAAEDATSTSAKKSADAPTSKAVLSDKKPEFSAAITLVTLTDGHIQINDQNVTPPFKLALDQINTEIKGISTEKDSEINAALNTAITEKGQLEVTTRLQPFVQPLNLNATLKLNAFAMDVLTPYVGTYTGSTVGDGKLNLNFDYQIANDKLEAQHKILINKFGFGERFESDKALNLPFGFVVSLLKDAQGKINIALPVEGDLSDPKFRFWRLIGQTARNFVLKVATAPFSFLASAVGSGGSEEDFGSVRFTPGESAINAEEQQKLRLLIKALKERPALVVEVSGSYDPKHDWRAIKAKIFNEQYAAMQKEYERDNEWILRKLYQKNFGLPAYWEFIEKYQAQHPDDTDQTQIVPALKEDLIENAPANNQALAELAEKRADGIYEFFLQQGEFSDEHLKRGATKEAAGNAEFVPLELTLTVLE